MITKHITHERHDGASPVFRLLEEPRPAGMAIVGEVHRVEIAPSLVENLSRLADREEIPISTLLLAAIETVLSRWCGQEGIVVKMTADARRADAAEEPAGPVNDVITIRTDLAGNPSFRDLIRKVKESVLEAMALVTSANDGLPATDRSADRLLHTGTWQISVNSLLLPELLSLSDRAGGHDSIEHEQPSMEVALDIAVLGGSTILNVHYDGSCFSNSVIAQLCRQISQCLELVVVDPDRRILSVPLSSDTGDASAAAVVERLENGESISERLVYWAGATPEAIAVTDDEASVTYRALNTAANALANKVLATGMRVGDTIAIVCDRSAPLLWAILGSWKAGCSVMLLDPALSSEQVVHRLNSVPVRGLIALQSPSDFVWQPDSRESGFLDLRFSDGSWASVQDWSRQHANHEPPPLHLRQSLAYLVFTSGTSGAPKAVGTPHGALVHFIAWYVERLSLKSGTKFGSLSGLGYDPIWRDLCTPVWIGARAVLSRQPATDAAAIAAWIQRHSVNIIHITPPLGRLLTACSSKCLSLRWIVVGGDRLLSIDVSGLLTFAPLATTVNAYGTSETPQIMCAHFGGSSQTCVPIGRPIDGVTIIVRNRGGVECDLYEPGEIQVSTRYLSWGYINDPALTAARFLASPLGNGERVYKTGDLGRWDAQGNLQWLGRIDGQIKIRGFRVEIAEIETHLLAQPGIKQAAVVWRDDVSGEKALVAYFVAEGLDDRYAIRLRSQLKAELPDHMIPTAFVKVDSLPLTPNGKLDHRALPLPVMKSYASREYTPPVGLIEQWLAKAWSDALSRQTVGRDDNFFDLGGHSLLAVKLVSRIREDFKIDIALRDVFEAKVLSEMALRIERGAADRGNGIAPRAQRAEYQLSHAQQRLWFLAQLPGPSERYHISWGARITGDLDRSALRNALDQILRRHESLRTQFISRDGMTFQRILPQTGTYFDLREQVVRAGPHIDSQVRDLLEKTVKEPFDLTQGSLIRGVLIQENPLSHTLLITMHHIVSDGWSVQVLLDELMVLYGSGRLGNTNPLSAVPIQYADYAEWHRGWLIGKQSEDQRRYWRETLTGAPELITLPSDYCGLSQRHFTGGFVKIAVEKPLTVHLQDLSRQCGTTLFVTLLAAWAVLLLRLSRQEDMVIGCPVANRRRGELERLIGCFVNTLAMRIKVAGAQTVAELLHHVADVAVSAQDNQDLPFEQVVELMNPVRSLTHNPLFQVMFVWAGGSRDEGFRLSGTSCDAPMSIDRTTSQFDLTLDLSEEDGRIVGGIEYSDELYERTTIVRWAEYLKVLLAAMTRDVHQPVCRLPLLKAGEMQALLVDRNSTEVAIPGANHIHQLFEGQVERTPGAIAAIHHDKSLTYAELNARANKLAYYLRRLGVKPETRVAICVDRSLEMLVAIFAVLKAGGAYVPLDPQYPAERLAYIIRDCEPIVALVNQSGVKHLTRKFVSELARKMTVLDLVSQESTWSQYPASNPNPQSAGLTRRHLAYILYTSGSTGHPKGVMIEHANVLNLILAHIEYCGLSADDRVLQFSSFAFDASVEEIFPPLTVGARIVLRPHWMVSPDIEFREFTKSQRITVLELPTAFWHQWAQEKQGKEEMNADDGSIRLVVVGGEKADRQRLEAWRALVGRGRCKWLNTYGPTEATVYATAFLLDPEDDIPTGDIPIGRAIFNTRVYVLDDGGVPLPTGVVGEIYIGGAGVARGYWNRPALTGERFIASPFVEGDMLYKSGDLGRILADGNAQYVGRNDDQVKVRGFRIEVGEIEARLRQYCDVKEAIVLARDDVQSGPCLVAYVTCCASRIDIEDVRSHLKTMLPAYMVPSYFVVVEALPMTPNGKIDRRSLPKPDSHPNAQGRPLEAPHGDTEEKLADIWRGVLQNCKIGRHENFFDLGGNSLIVSQISARVREVFRVEIRSSAVFTAPTVSLLAGQIDAALKSEVRGGES